MLCMLCMTQVKVRIVGLCAAFHCIAAVAVSLCLCCEPERAYHARLPDVRPLQTLPGSHI